MSAISSPRLSIILYLFLSPASRRSFTRHPAQSCEPGAVRVGRGKSRLQRPQMPRHPKHTGFLHKPDKPGHTAILAPRRTSVHGGHTRR
eukprot:1943214-Pyramimonas_sp.AAC.1